MRVFRVVILLAALALGQPHSRAVERSPADVAREILSDPSFQKEIVPERTQRTSGRVRSAPAPAPAGGSGSLAILLAWLGVGVAICLALVWLAAGLQRRKTDRPATAEDREEEAVEAGVDPSLVAVERLAAGGRFTEAIHELLLLAVRRLSERHGRTISGWLTSRELTRLLPANEQERTRFTHLVNAVERSLFGGQAVDRPGFELCMEKFRGLSS